MKDDMISRQAAIDALQNSHFPGAPYVDAGISIAIGVICDLPTVDAVPVVRCRNCRFSQRINDWVYYCYVFNVDKMLNQYCDMGELKDGDHHEG